ncbi:ABC transporter ATP-binding protein [Oribacterium sp. HCP3S3_B9]|uniref:ABC transporter ATP-binding protein n=1 Tax=Oribacterium sp. HCP3S3_B9 TaxID=3438946 RepID=UPI003F8B774F
MSLIEVKDLKYRYPGTTQLALDGVSFTVEKGEFIGIAGENGAGKSSLSQALLGLIPQFYKGAYGGSVTVCGMDARSTPVSELCRHVGLVFQNPFNQLSGAKDTVYDEVGYGLQNLGFPPEEIRTRVESVLRCFGIWEYRDRNPFDLSGGQLQRVAICSVLAMKPDVLILDEPTSQLDPEGSEEVFHTVDELTKMGITIIMIEQKIEKLAGYCDRVLLMHQGHVVDYDTPRKIFSREDLYDLGVNPPAYTCFARANALVFEDGTLPVTHAETLERVKASGVDRATLIASLRTMTAGVQMESATPQPVAAQPARAGVDAAAAAASASRSSDHASEAAGAADATFQVKDLRFSYVKGREVLHGLNLALDHRPTAIIGQNGAGKTTLVRVLKGLLKPDSGEIRYQGENLETKTVAELASRVGYVFQNPDDQIFKYKVLEEVMFGPLNIGMSPQEAEASAHEALRMVGLDEKAGENPYDLELSDRKMVAIASVLAMNTDVIILDEPTIGQSWNGREKIREIMQAKAAEGKLVIAILHDMDFVANSFARVIAMAHGEILADGAPAEVFRNHPVLEKAALAAPPLYELLEELEEM